MKGDLRVSRTVGAANVLALLALLAAWLEEGVAGMAVAANTLNRLAHDEVLAAGARWLGDEVLVLARRLRGTSTSSGGGRLLLALALLWWRARAVLAALVRALGADALLAKLGLALVAGAVHTQANLLLHTLGWGSQVDADLARVDAGLLQQLRLLLCGVGRLGLGVGRRFAAQG